MISTFGDVLDPLALFLRRRARAVDAGRRGGAGDGLDGDISSRVAAAGPGDWTVSFASADKKVDRRVARER